MSLHSATIDPNEPVVIRGYQFDYEAELARALLESHDVPCMLLPQTHLTLGPVAVRLAVRRDDVERAIALLDQPRLVLDEGSDADDADGQDEGKWDGERDAG